MASSRELPSILVEGTGTVDAPAASVWLQAIYPHGLVLPVEVEGVEITGEVTYGLS